MARIVWFGSISVDIGLIYEEEKKRKKCVVSFFLNVKGGLALVLAPSSAVYCSPL